MKTPQTLQGRAARAAHHDEAKPQPAPVTWHKPNLPRIGQREPSLAADEWRPGEAAKRGYEKAVEDWWWL